MVDTSLSVRSPESGGLPKEWKLASGTVVKSILSYDEAPGTHEWKIPIQFEYLDECREVDTETYRRLLEQSRFQNARPVGRSGTEKSARTVDMGSDYEKDKEAGPSQIDSANRG